MRIGEHMSKTHALFQRFPITQPIKLSTGDAPTPYHIYDGYGAFIGGTADLAAVRQLLKPEGVQPLQTQDGHALMGIWICDFVDASLGPHHELQFSIFVSQGNSPFGISSKPMGLLAAMFTRPELLMLCHGLWNNTAPVVAYNRERLSLNARLTHSQISRRDSELNFAFADAGTGQSILSGKLAHVSQPSLSANMQLMSLVGFSPLMALGRAPWLSMKVVNPIGVQLDRNAIAMAYTKPATTNIRASDSHNPVLSFGDTPYSGLGFQPRLVQFMTGFKFVYMDPI